MILLSIRYNGTTCLLVIVQYFEVYHYIIVTVVYQVLGILYHSCVCRGSVIIDFISLS